MQDPPTDTQHPAGDGMAPTECRWVLSLEGAPARRRWIGRLWHRDALCLAETRGCNSRQEVHHLIRTASRIAHIDDCYARIDDDPLGPRFLLSHPDGAVLLVGSPRRNHIERERALAVVKASARALLEPDPVTVDG